MWILQMKQRIDRDCKRIKGNKANIKQEGTPVRKRGGMNDEMNKEKEKGKSDSDGNDE